MAVDPLYFIALIPPTPIKERIISLKRQVASLFESKAALRSPPHITLHMPFRYPEKKLKKMTQVLEGYFAQQQPFDLMIHGFGAFPPRVVYVQVELNESLEMLQKNLGTAMARKLSIHNIDYRNRPFKPHITIGFRDLKKPQFKEAWRYYQGQEFTSSFLVHQATLLRHNGKIWEEDIHFKFRNS